MSTVALVTGATRNLGLALSEGLARRLGRRDVVYLTGRDPARVAEAADTLSKTRAEVRARLLDVTDQNAVSRAAAHIAEEHGGIDIVFSNHYFRIDPDDDPAAVVDRYVDVNNLGTTRVLRAFTPLLRDGAKLFVVASRAGSLYALAPALHHHFDELETLDDVDNAICAWRDAVRERRAAGQAWPAWINIPSKIGQVAAVHTVARARRENDLARGVLITAVCPGLIDTGASRPWLDMTGAQEPEEAARALIDLALDPHPDPGFYGQLVLSNRIVRWKP